MQEFDEYTIHKPKAVSFDFSRFEKPKSGATNNRASLIEPFVKRLNASRKAGGYRPYSAGYVASKMAHIATDELDFHYKQLDQSKNFCALWHYYNVPKKK
jgi:hypothetical protein